MRLLFLVLGVFLLSSQLQAGDCFLESKVKSFKNDGRDSIVVETIDKQKYDVDVWPCFELEWAEEIAFKSWSGSVRICKDDYLFVIDHFTGRAIERCHIKEITKFDKEIQE
jgi:hypothetical protein